MHTDPGSATPIDQGLLVPVAVGHDGLVSDDAVLAGLVEAERALVLALVDVGAAGDDTDEVVRQAHDLQASDVAAIAAAGVAGGNPVIPLVAALRSDAGDAVRPWVHRGATSQDILDSALMYVSRRAVAAVMDDLRATIDGLREFVGAHRSLVTAARTLTQQAVPTTVGAKGAIWLEGVRRAADKLERAADQLPAQLGGAGGTLASFVELFGADRAARLPAAYAQRLGLVEPGGVWHTSRWPVTELSDALVQVTDALGKFAADVATGSRTEIAELAEPTGGGSSAMPQKRNPARAVLIRSAALRAPGLAATIHLAAALAVDERPDGAWHAEWPSLRELLRVALGASRHAADLASGLRVDAEAITRNLALTDGLIVSERLGAVLGSDRVSAIVGRVAAGDDLHGLVADAVRDVASTLSADDLLDPAQYIGLAQTLADRAHDEGEPA